MIAPKADYEPPVKAVLTPEGRIRLVATAVGFSLLGGLVVAMALGLAIGEGDFLLVAVMIPHALAGASIFSALVASLLFLDSDEPVRDAAVLLEDPGGTPVDVHLSTSWKPSVERRKVSWSAWFYPGRRGSERKAA